MSVDQIHASRVLTNLLLAAVCVSIAGEAFATANGARSVLQVEEGYIPTNDGTRLFFQKVGNGPKKVIVPAGLYLFDDFKHLTEGRTLIFYDMRGRGRSDQLSDQQRQAIVSIHDDVKDVERVRQHFKFERISLIGYSYLGLMTVMYALDHPQRVERIIQLGPVPLKFGTKYPENLTNTQKLPEIGADATEVANVEKMWESGYYKTNPKQYCEKQWSVTRYRLVGNPANVNKLPAKLCDLPNEWPANLAKHFEHSFASVQRLDIPKTRISEVKIPVLTIHGMKDRNAAYGAGREWALILPDARLLTVPGAAHQLWADEPQLVFSAVSTFLDGKWPPKAERVTRLELNQ